MRRSFTALIIIIFASAYSALAFAWCEDHPDVKKEFSTSEYVFTGKVISEEKVHQVKDFFDGIYYKIQILKIFRGKPIQTITMFNENSSGRFPMEVGQTFTSFNGLRIIVSRDIVL